MSHRLTHLPRRYIQYLPSKIRYLSNYSLSHTHKHTQGSTVLTKPALSWFFMETIFNFFYVINRLFWSINYYQRVHRTSTKEIWVFKMIPNKCGLLTNSCLYQLINKPSKPFFQMTRVVGVSDSFCLMSLILKQLPQRVCFVFGEERENSCATCIFHTIVHKTPMECWWCKPHWKETPTHCTLQKRRISKIPLLCRNAVHSM